MYYKLTCTTKPQKEQDNLNLQSRGPVWVTEGQTPLPKPRGEGCYDITVHNDYAHVCEGRFQYNNVLHP
jgi:hypothetical protein